MTHPLTALFLQVKHFHLVFSHPTAEKPVMQSADRANARADWITEEANEIRDAQTVAEQADGYIDAIYFGIGGLVELGVDPGPLWDLVHGANMAKVQPDGSVKRREDGKIIKPEGWIAPDALIAAEIDRQTA